VITLLQRIFFVWAMLWTSLVMVVCGVGTVVTMWFTSNPRAFNFWSTVWGVGITTGMGIRIRTRFSSPLPTDQPYVFAINHQVALDIPAVGSAIPVPFGWVAKAELQRVPFLGASIRSSPSVFIDRSHPKRSIETMKVAGERIRNGVSIAIFPEGSRSHSSELGEFKRGAFLLAIEAQVPVVPVTIINAHTLFNEKARTARPGIMRIEVGDPIDIQGWTRSDIPKLMECVRDVMQSHLPDSGTGQKRVP
jgi:1-acyl-sn-glycerol-3-phosphate acyltransferase